MAILGQDAAKAQALAGELGAGVVSGTTDTTPQGNIVVLAVPCAAATSLVTAYGEDLACKTIVDITNPVNFETFESLVVAPGTSAAEEIVALAPATARVVKAFNTTFAGTLVAGESGGQPLDVFIAGDNANANLAVSSFVGESGLRPLVMGPLKRSRELEGFQFVLMTMQANPEFADFNWDTGFLVSKQAGLKPSPERVRSNPPPWAFPSCSCRPSCRRAGHANAHLDQIQEPPMLGTITITTRPGITVHTYTSPAQGLEATSHIVELTTQLLIIDAQYALPFAAEAADYAKTLGKPIARVYVSHDHPDHWFGAATFDAPIYALAAIRDAIEANGDAMAATNHAQVGDLVPDHAIVPEETVTPGEEIIDGVRFTFTEVKEAESASLLVIAAPDEGIVFAQDLIYNNLHLFIAETNFAGWTKGVEALRGGGFSVVLPGHGLPGGPELYDFVLDYLAAAEPLLAKASNGDDLKTALVKAFPDAEGTMLLDIQNGYIFPQH